MAQYGQRIQRSRKPGARVPSDTVYVGRSGKGLGRWGNPFRVAGPAAIALAGCWHLDTWKARQWAAAKLFAHWIAGRLTDMTQPVQDAALAELRQQGSPLPPTLDQIRAELTWHAGGDGRDLCCWCSPFVDCHADILRAVAIGADPIIASGTSPLWADNFRMTERNREFARREIRENIRRRGYVKGWTAW
ncbi:MAG: DUF4326 domain-containing protein [Bosea sp.]|uniref:DUF4326 domain-containing protein n=1 Tax=unclassified Bosea (in: a-proteobacteria) TaxID=2653178 RepID=UPI0009613951|nr:MULTISPECIES: DUF4326 domain-containing protein [unclassified Bosea (in: a-proteobacteria)]MBN9458998.1 DUF4326 domain-containing protein [Bosea sp. (in: a-proteobacteria)]OJV06258.1 MAG: hypothetical protein BGO20_08355 [Bosea sp. 67-29]